MTKHFKAYALPFSDPDMIDDADEVYGDYDNDNDEPAFPLILDICEDSPVGQHQFHILDPQTCIHCGKKT